MNLMNPEMMTSGVAAGRPDRRKPNLPPATTFASAVASMARPLDFVIGNMHRHPEIFRSGLLGFSAYVVHHPEYVRHVLSANARNYVKFEKYRYLRLIGGNGLVTNEGDSWLRQRKLIQPAFHRGMLERACATMCQETNAVVDRLSGERRPVADVGELMGELTIAIAARTLFSSDVGQSVPTIRHELDLSQRLGNILLRVPLPLYDAVPYLPVFNRITRAAKRLRAIVQEMIDRRRSSGERPGDLLDALLEARDEGDVTGMTDEQLRDEVLTLLLAGHETSLLALSWAFYLVARHPEVYERLRAEAREVYGPDGVDLAGLERLTWARAVAREAMRLYPPVYLMGRTALADDKLGEYDVPAGTNVMVNVYGLHRHPRYWTEPDRFLPERMLDPKAWEPGNFVYLPFGAGPRSCIGSRFALYEMQIILAAFAKAFSFETVSKAEVRPSPQITLKADRPIRLRFNRRPG